MLYNEVILFPESNSAEAFGLPISGSSPTEIYVKVVAYILERYPELVGQKETHFTDDPDRAAQYTGSTRDMVVEGRTVYIKTGFSTKDKWKNLERICQLAGISFSIGEGGTLKSTPVTKKPAPEKSNTSKKADSDIDYAALAAKYAAQPVHDDYYAYNFIYGGECVVDNRYVKEASDLLLHDKFCESNLIAYKGWYYYIKPLKGSGKSVCGLFRRLASEKQKETLLIQFSGDDIEEMSDLFVPYQRMFGIHKDIIYFRKDSAIHYMNLDGSNMRKLDIPLARGTDAWRLYSPYPIDGGLAHLNGRYDTLYFYDYRTGTDEKITEIRQILGTCGSKVFFFKGAKRTIFLFDAGNQSVMKITDLIPSLNKKNIIHIDCRHEIIYYTESTGKNFVPAHKASIYGVNFNGELVDVWEAPKLPDIKFEYYDGIVFNGEIYALKTITTKSVQNNSEIVLQNYSVYLFSRSGEVKNFFHSEEGRHITYSTPLNVAGNSIVLYLNDTKNHASDSRWALIPVDSTHPEENYIILHDPASIK